MVRLGLKLPAGAASSARQAYQFKKIG